MHLCQSILCYTFMSLWSHNYFKFENWSYLFSKWKVSCQGDNWNMQEMILWTILIPKLWVYSNQTRHSSFIWYAHIYLNDFQGERSRLRQIWDKKQDVLCINCQWDYVPSQSTHNPIFSKNFMLIWNIINMIKYINHLNLYINLKQILHFSNTIDILQSI